MYQFESLLVNDVSCILRPKSFHCRPPSMSGSSASIVWVSAQAWANQQSCEAGFHCSGVLLSAARQTHATLRVRHQVSTHVLSVVWVLLQTTGIPKMFVVDLFGGDMLLGQCSGSAGKSCRAPCREHLGRGRDGSWKTLAMHAQPQRERGRRERERATMGSNLGSRGFTVPRDPKMCS